MGRSFFRRNRTHPERYRGSLAYRPTSWGNPDTPHHTAENPLRYLRSQDGHLLPAPPGQYPAAYHSHPYRVLPEQSGKCPLRSVPGFPLLRIPYCLTRKSTLPVRWIRLWSGRFPRSGMYFPKRLCFPLLLWSLPLKKLPLRNHPPEKLLLWNRPQMLLPIKNCHLRRRKW